MKNKKIVWIIIGIVSIALIALAITYAYWQITKTQEGVNEITTACLDISLVDAESGNTGVTLLEQYPISDTEGAALKPYKFTVTNNCDTAVDYQIALESIGDSTSALSASGLKVMLDDTIKLLSSNENVTPTVSGAYASHKLGMGTLAKSGDAGSSVTHELRLWVDESAPVSENNKAYNGKITVTIGQGIKAPVIKEGSLAYSLINAYGGESAITENSDFSVKTTGMYKTEDDDGDSYYYRGDVTNNYVQFGAFAVAEERYRLWRDDECNFLGVCNGNFHNNYGEFKTLEECEQSFEGSTEGAYKCEDISIKVGDPIYWRVLRVNGDGTLRLIFDGSELNENYFSKGVTVGYTAFNSTNDADYKNSLVKRVVEGWYQEHLNEDYGSYIADKTFCNDKEVSSDSYVDDTHEIVYKSQERMETNPTLKCSREEDKYTVANGSLINPVGIITGDELALVSLPMYSQDSGYLTRNDKFWTMTPRSYRYNQYLNEDTTEFYASYGDHFTSYDMKVDYFGARPVINLKADVLFTYNSEDTAGTIDDPYVITTN